MYIFHFSNVNQYLILSYFGVLYIYIYIYYIYLTYTIGRIPIIAINRKSNEIDSLQNELTISIDMLPYQIYTRYYNVATNQLNQLTEFT